MEHKEVSAQPTQRVQFQGGPEERDAMVVERVEPHGPEAAGAGTCSCSGEGNIQDFLNADEMSMVDSSFAVNLCTNSKFLNTTLKFKN